MANDQDNENSELNETVAEVSATPGSLLKLERERRELSEKVVADQLHITMHYVRSIEADRYDKLPGTVFARGYIKSYALLLELEPKELIALFDSLIEEKDEARQEVTRRIEARRQKDRNLPWLIVSLIAFILGFTGLWAFNHFFVVFDEGSYLSGQQRNNAMAELSDPVVSGIDPDFERNQSILPVPGGGDEAGVQIEEHITLMATGTDVLQIRFSGESWIEVSDDSEFPPYRDIRAAGHILQITGNAPFNVLLGDAPYASIKLNGIPVDVSNNIRIDNSARLVVGL